MTLFWPEAMLESIRAEAMRLDRNPSWCVQKAWRIASGELTSLRREEMPAGSDARYEQAYPVESKKVKETLTLPQEMLDEMKREAARRDRSVSWIAQRTWFLAAPSIAAMVAAEEE